MEVWISAKLDASGRIGLDALGCYTQPSRVNIYNVYEYVAMLVKSASEVPVTLYNNDCVS